MRPCPPEPSIEQYHGIPYRDDLAAWRSQQEGFARLRDTSDHSCAVLCEQLGRLRLNWTGECAAAFDIRVTRVIEQLAGIRASAAANSDGMREMAAVVSGLRADLDALRAEGDDWRANPDGDDPATQAALRELVRQDMGVKVRQADEVLARYAHSFLIEPPAPLAVTPGDPITVDLQTASPEPSSSRSEPPAPVPAPIGIEGGSAPAAGAATAGPGGGPAAGGAGGPSFQAVRQQERSRMRSPESRQDIADRRAGATPAPHPSGPVLTGTVYRYFPDYGSAPERSMTVRVTVELDGREALPAAGGAASARPVPGKGAGQGAGESPEQARQLAAAQARLRQAGQPASVVVRPSGDGAVWDPDARRVRRADRRRRRRERLA